MSAKKSDKGRRPSKASKKPRESSKTRVSSRKRRPKASEVVAAGSVSEEVVEKLEGLQSQFGDLQEAVLLTDMRDDIEEIETALAMLPPGIEELRTRGYVFRSFLDNKVSVLSEQWEEVQGRLSSEMGRRVRDLEREADSATHALRRAASGQTADVAQAEAALETLERKVGAAQSAIEAMYGTLRTNVNQTRSKVEQIRWLLDQVDEASFQLYPAEDPVAACRAQYMESEKEGPEGILYLTDERLIFERKEKVATKKVLFIATEKEEVQELVFEVPIGHVEDVKASQKGFLGRKEMLELVFGPEADLSDVTLRLRGADNEEWAGLIGRVRSGEISEERTRPKEEAVAEAAREVPTKCPTCGATLDMAVVRGMREVKCEYCGAVIRL
jgi:hypothetical protein